MTTLMQREIQRNMRAVAHAIGTDEVIRNIHRRVQNVPLLRQNHYSHA
jgi:hypothetical protein